MDLPRNLTPEDFAAIEAEMKKIIKADIPLNRRVVPASEAVSYTHLKRSSSRW